MDEEDLDTVEPDARLESKLPNHFKDRDEIIGWHKGVKHHIKDIKKYIGKIGRNYTEDKKYYNLVTETFRDKICFNKINKPL